MTCTPLCEWHTLRVLQGWSPDREWDRRRMAEAGYSALRLDPDHALGLALLGHGRLITERCYDEVLALMDRAFELAPNDSESLVWSVPAMAFVGRAEEAAARAERAMALSPHDPLLYRSQHFLALAQYAAGEYEASARVGIAVAHSHPGYTSNLRFTAAALAGAGRLKEAQEVGTVLCRLQPGLRAGEAVHRSQFRDAAARRRYSEHLIAAGVPA